MHRKGLLMLLAAALMKPVFCVQCYDCTFPDNPKCGINFNPDKIDTAECYMCQKVKLPRIGGGYEPIVRGCYNSTLCTNLSRCYECKKPLCNSSSEFIVPSVVSLIFLSYAVNKFH